MGSLDEDVLAPATRPVHLNSAYRKIGVQMRLTSYKRCAIEHLGR